MKAVFTVFLFVFFSFEGFTQVYEGSAKVSRWLKKERRIESSREDGGYLLFQGGLRKHNNSNRNDVFTGGYGNFNGVVGVNYGFRKQNTSFETGLGFVWQYHRGEHYLESIEKSFKTFGVYNAIFLPFVVKYDVPTGPSKKFRFGAMGSTNIFIHQIRNYKGSGRGKYVFDIYNPQDEPLHYNFDWIEPNIKVFLKVGIYAEVQVFKSSFLNFQVSKAISPWSYRTVSYDWEYGGESGTVVERIHIQGTMFELAYKLPLNIFSANK
ncbi:hypothetical protein MM213_05325 [Belliella sp. R4-6]|uniref:Outer membrane protein beta-barrel domain-containing protein n=1 Tax=Belliella alkalica TaxID=1730871 RepID=A0ABS9VAJ6_9BACT|nr:hypothetical protein [Belliella alkalica]MCH7412898.1 hypothetical protein [Belliella alkalica]